MKQKIILTFLGFGIAGAALLTLRPDAAPLIPCAGEKSLVIIVPSYNNSQWVDKNLQSIFSQQYPDSKVRVIYIDDCSSDDTYEHAKSYIEKNNYTDRLTLIRNKFRRGAMANHFMAGHMCADNEIMIHLDGDDWLKHDRVLQKVNQVYADPNVWMTYGQYEIYPGGKKGTCREFPKIVHEKNIYREYEEYEWISTHLRTCYAWLFKKIMLKDCIHGGQWLPVNCDRVMMFTMLEMAREHCVFIPDVLYVYNCATSGNDFKKHLVTQWYFNYVIGARPKYQRVAKAPDLTKISNKAYPTTMVIFSDDNPMLAHALLDSVQRHVSGLNKSIILYQASNHEIQEAYTMLQGAFPDVSFHACHRGNKTNVPVLINQILSQTEYVLLAHDGILIKDPIDLQSCTQALKKTHAYGFYFTLGKNITTHQNLKRKQHLPPFVDVEDNIWAWSFDCGEYNWKKPHSLSLALYNAYAVKKALYAVVYDSPKSLEELWASIPFDMSNIGLIYTTSSALIFDEPMTSSTALTLFKKGFKLDVGTIAGITNQSIHTSPEIPLIT